jgi:hypothetical protein
VEKNEVLAYCFFASREEKKKERQLGVHGDSELDVPPRVIHVRLPINQRIQRITTLSALHYNS